MNITAVHDWLYGIIKRKPRRVNMASEASMAGRTSELVIKPKPAHSLDRIYAGEDLYAAIRDSDGVVFLIRGASNLADARSKLPANWRERATIKRVFCVFGKGEC